MWTRSGILARAFIMTDLVMVTRIRELTVLSEGAEHLFKTDVILLAQFY
jgi:hypothetical protein